MSYELINPLIAGTFNIRFGATDPLDAAKMFWNSFTTANSINYTPQFVFTMRNIVDDSLYHFIVNEKGTTSNVTKFTIELYNVEPSGKYIDQFLKEVDRMRLLFGLPPRESVHDEWDDVDKGKEGFSISDDIIKYVKSHKALKEIAYYWYCPSLYDINVMYSPLFSQQPCPFVQLWNPKFF